MWTIEVDERSGTPTAGTLHAIYRRGILPTPLTCGQEFGPINATDQNGTTWHVPKARLMAFTGHGSDPPSQLEAKSVGEFWKKPKGAA